MRPVFNDDLRDPLDACLVTLSSSRLTWSSPSSALLHRPRLSTTPCRRRMRLVEAHERLATRTRNISALSTDFHSHFFSPHTHQDYPQHYLSPLSRLSHRAYQPCDSSTTTYYHSLLLKFLSRTVKRSINLYLSLAFGLTHQFQRSATGVLLNVTVATDGIKTLPSYLRRSPFHNIHRKRTPENMGAVHCVVQGNLLDVLWRELLMLV